jgi:predicted transcriptional regulator
MPDSSTPPSDKISLSAEIVAAYVSHNSVTPGGLAGLIESVHGALTSLGAVTAAPEPTPLVPAVSIRKSINPDYLICLEDGKKFKSLRRHLKSHGLTPEQYRQKWGFPRAIRWLPQITQQRGRHWRKSSALDSYARTPRTGKRDESPRRRAKPLRPR